METLATRLKERARILGITHVEAARRAGLDRRNYGHYVSGRSRPNYENLIKIADALHTTPNYLLGYRQSDKPEIDQLIGACQALSGEELRVLIGTAETLAKLR